jgi:hypothetical protein
MNLYPDLIHCENVLDKEFNLPLLSHILALLINSTEAGNLLGENGALHAMLDARARARVQLVLVTRMSFCLIAKLLVQGYSSIPLVAPLCF